MDKISAWHEVFNLSYGNQWQAIPENLKRILNLDSRLGIAGGILCTQKAAQGAQDFISRLNSIQEKSK